MKKNKNKLLTTEDGNEGNTYTITDKFIAYFILSVLVFFLLTPVNILYMTYFKMKQ